MELQNTFSEIFVANNLTSQKKKKKNKKEEKNSNKQKINQEFII